MNTARQSRNKKNQPRMNTDSHGSKEHRREFRELPRIEDRALLIFAPIREICSRFIGVRVKTLRLYPCSSVSIRGLNLSSYPLNHE
jgi:hypothetical protein